jgi:hypothetical protein
MSYFTNSIEDHSITKEEAHTKRFTGKCTNCEKSFDITFDMVSGNTTYECACGDFTLNAHDDTVSYRDNY